MTLIKTMTTSCLLILALVAGSQVAADNLDLANGIVLKAVTVTGATVFNDADLERAMTPAIGKKVYIEDILGMVDAITALYVEGGYITSGAVLDGVSCSDFSPVTATILLFKATVPAQRSDSPHPRFWAVPSPTVITESVSPSIFSEAALATCVYHSKEVGLTAVTALE